MASTSTDSCWALVKYHNGYPLYGILMLSKLKCLSENVIRYNGCNYESSILLTGSKPNCKLFLSIIQNQPSVIINKTWDCHVDSRIKETFHETGTEALRPAEIVRSIRTGINVSDALLNISNYSSSGEENILNITTDTECSETSAVIYITYQSEIENGTKIATSEIILPIDDKSNINFVTALADDKKFLITTTDAEYDSMWYETSAVIDVINQPEIENGTKIGTSETMLPIDDKSYIHLVTALDNDEFPTTSQANDVDCDMSENDSVYTSDEEFEEFVNIASSSVNIVPATNYQIEKNNPSPTHVNVSDFQTTRNDELNEREGHSFTPETHKQNEFANKSTISSQNNNNNTTSETEITENLNYARSSDEDTDVDSATSHGVRVNANKTKFCSILSPAEIKIDAIQHAIFDGTLCSRTASIGAENNILFPEGKKYWKLKYHFCIFCKRRVSRFARHLTAVHKNEPEVVRINALPIKNLTRLDLIQAIRHRGMLMYNVDDRYNQGDTIVVRRPSKQNKENNIPYIPCATCGGNFRKRNITRHSKRCNQSKDGKGATLTARLLGKPILQKYFDSVSTLISKGKVDILSQTCVQDTAILLYGAKLITDYESEKHRDNDIRSKLRQLAQLLIAAKKEDTSIKELMDVFAPEKIRIVELAIKSVCAFDSETREYQKPSLAVHINTLIRKCCDCSITYMIETNNQPRRLKMESFLHLLRNNLVGVARSGVNKLQRHKMTNGKRMPVASDINMLNTYLKARAAEAYKTLQMGFNVAAWNVLSDCTLVLIMIFNRKRTGECERILISNYNSKKAINEDSDIYKTLNEDDKLLCKHFARMEIIAKWRRVVVMLFPPLFISYIDTILKFRGQAGVSINNLFLFGTSAGPYSHRFANVILADAAIKCGAKHPSSLRGTNLRKHIATVTQMVNMTDNDIKLLSSFMGHEQAIHESSYRQTDSTYQIAKLTKLLMAFNEGALDKIKGRSLDEIEMDRDLLENNSTEAIQNKPEISKKINLKTAKNRFCSSLDSYSDFDVSSESDSDKDQETVLTNSKESKIIRKRWTVNELKDFHNYFGSYFSSEKSPSLSLIRSIKNKSAFLKNRTEKQINAQISNKRKIYFTNKQ